MHFCWEIGCIKCWTKAFPIQNMQAQFVIIWVNIWYTNFFHLRLKYLYRILFMINPWKWKWNRNTNPMLTRGKKRETQSIPSYRTAQAQQCMRLGCMIFFRSHANRVEWMTRWNGEKKLRWEAMAFHFKYRSKYDTNRTIHTHHNA